MSQLFTIQAGAREARAAELSGEFENRQQRFNAKISELNAKDAEKRGREAVKDFREEGRQLLGSQRVKTAASGVELDTGSSLENELDTRKQLKANELRIKSNAWREAWGFRTNAYEQKIGGTAALFAGRNIGAAKRAEAGAKAFEQTKGQIADAAKPSPSPGG